MASLSFISLLFTSICLTQIVLSVIQTHQKLPSSPKSLQFIEIKKQTKVHTLPIICWYELEVVQYWREQNSIKMIYHKLVLYKTS